MHWRSIYFGMSGLTRVVFDEAGVTELTAVVDETSFKALVEASSSKASLAFRFLEPIHNLGDIVAMIQPQVKRICR